MTDVVRLTLNASDEEILQVVRDWCARLAVEDYAGALSMVLHDAEWTPEMFRDLISTHAGWHELQGFLERGYAAFKHMKGAEEFLNTIETRETGILDRIYAGDPDPFDLVGQG